LHSRVTGFVERVYVDRGSAVKQGELLVELSAPEMTAQIAEAQAKLQAIEAEHSFKTTSNISAHPLNPGLHETPSVFDACLIRSKVVCDAASFRFRTHSPVSGQHSVDESAVNVLI
jgi:pyruvate/2-oxoglutarate dehydrogenase complex dihydrolipoamide acyltransferase (E2) component